MVKKVLCLVLGLLLFLGNTVALAETRISPKYVNTDIVTANLSISSKGVATCSGTVSPSGKYESTISVNLQKKNGSSWSTIKTWTGSGSTLMGCSASGTYTVSRGTYRVYVCGYVGTEFFSKYSAEKTY